MRWVFWLVVTVMSIHPLAMTAMPHAIASPMQMAQATIAHPEPCSSTGVQQSQDPCMESCAILQDTTVSRTSATVPSPSTDAGYTVDTSRSARLSFGTRSSGLPAESGCQTPSVLQVLRI
jgi:hypothetical protein